MIKNSVKFAGVAITTLGLALSAYAQVSLDTVYNSILASTSDPGDNINVNWEVSTQLNVGVYTYEYQIVNPLAPNISVDFFNVSFDAVSGGNVLTTGGGSFSEVVADTGVNWAFSPVDGGQSTPALNTAGVLYFTSPDPPTLGDAGAQDMNPPSPWSSDPDGQEVAVPAPVPEPGGTTVALFGLVLAGAEALRRKLRKA